MEIKTKMTKAEATELLKKYIENERLQEHCLQVGKCMRYYADRLVEDGNFSDINIDQETWEVTGILHDLDWEKHPEHHPNKIKDILEAEELELEKAIMDAILGHAYPERTEVERETDLAKYLFACDELTGLITAYSYMKGGMQEMEVKGVKKKIKDKAFAKGVNRDDVHNGAKEIGLDLDTHIAHLLTALKN